MRFMLRGARLVDASTDRASGAVIIDDGKLEALDGSITHDADSDMPTFDVDGMILTPGFMDIHTHGGGGFNLHTSDPAEIDAFAHWAPSTGLTSFLVAVVGVPDALPFPQLEAAVVACERDNTGAEPVGIYLEGPYINLARRGAHLHRGCGCPIWTKLTHCWSYLLAICGSSPSRQSCPAQRPSFGDWSRLA